MNLDKRQMKGLANVADAPFDEHSFTNIANAEQANSALRYFSTHGSQFLTYLMREGYTPAETDLWMDTMWKRIITACRKFGVPLNPTAEAQAKRLNI